ncbi:hypothetical protein AAC387_Pa07g0340 [Persea americana]
MFDFGLVWFPQENHRKLLEYGVTFYSFLGGRKLRNKRFLAWQRFHSKHNQLSTGSSNKSADGLLIARGWGASCLKVMPSSGITWMFYEAWKDILLVQKRPF